jgi:AraC-like DNA-binding protein
MLTTPTRRLSVQRHDADSGSSWWELVTCDVDDHLREHVVDWCGWTEWTSERSRRREVPSGIVPLILDFVGAYRVATDHDMSSWSSHRVGFAAGLHESYALTESIGSAGGMQVNFTPIGAYLFFGRPMSDLTNRIVSFDDLLGGAATGLVDRLRDAPDWETRFDLLEQFIVRRLAAARAPTPSVVWAWRQLARTAGQIEVGRLASEIGCSRKHLIAQFRDQIGVPPKTVARILRFSRAVKLFTSQRELSGADVALACGYFDQAHFNKDFREFAGLTPTEYLRHRLPDLVSISND